MANMFKAEKIQRAISNILTKMAVYDETVYLVRFQNKTSLRDKALGISGKATETLINLSPHFAVNNSGYQDGLKEEGFIERGDFGLVVSSDFKLPNESVAYLFKEGDVFQYQNKRWQATSVKKAALGNLLLSQFITMKRQAGDGYEPISDI